MLCVLIRRIRHPVTNWLVSLEKFSEMVTGRIEPTWSVEGGNSIVYMPSDGH